MIYQALKGEKTQRTIEYLGTDFKTYKIYLEKTFKPGMTWENHGTVWHIDHIVPLMYQNPTREEVIKRLHYKNTHAMFAKENLSKGNRFISDVNYHSD